jgi:hypothetical protein
VQVLTLVQIVLLGMYCSLREQWSFSSILWLLLLIRLFATWSLSNTGSNGCLARLDGHRGVTLASKAEVKKELLVVSR